MRGTWNGKLVAVLAAGLLSLGSFAPTAGADGAGGAAAEWLRTGGAILDLQVSPAGARVELDGDRLHPGPALVTAGVHLLVVRAPGRRELHEIVRVAAGRVTKKRVDLVALPITGQLDLRTTPRHARVLLDGRLVGWSPRVMTLTAGRHRLQILAAGHRTQWRVVRVPRGATLTLRVDLPAERRRGRRPRVALLRAPPLVRDTVPRWPILFSNAPAVPSASAPSWWTSTTTSSATF